jgi:hypothetical protein
MTSLPHTPTRAARALWVALGVACVACGSAEPDSVAEHPSARQVQRVTGVRRIDVRGRADLVESSAAEMSRTQPGVLFTVNDANNAPIVFALDTSGAERGAWILAGARNVDWEAAALGPCMTHTGPDAPARACLTVGDVGDNTEARQSVTLYRIPEPIATAGGTLDTIETVQRLDFRYSDGPHDVEAMYVAPDGSTWLITKRPRLLRPRWLRQALVFRLPPDAWDAREIAVAELVDSLPIIPGSAPLRAITDAALSPDARYLAVRTYGEVYLFAADSLTGRPRADRHRRVCDLSGVEGGFGEGVTWLGRSQQLLLTREGRDAPMHVATCPSPPPP